MASKTTGLATAPIPCCKALDGCVISFRSVPIHIAVEEFDDVFAENGSDGVDGFMPRQAFSSEARHGSNDGLQIFGNLVFDNRMKNCMGRKVGQLDARHAVVRFHQQDSFLFVKREPLLGVGCVVRVIAIQRTVLLGV